MIIKYEDLEIAFGKIIDELDIPERYYEKANKSYMSLSNWIGRNDSTLLKYNPNVFLQGSFKLGTVIKPINSETEYDIDMVCKLSNLDKTEITQSDLKKIVGIEIKNYANSMNMNNRPNDGNRCWTLNYHDEAKFHIDVLPSIDDNVQFEKVLFEKKFEAFSSKTAIAIPDKSSDDYNVLTSDWEVSNPQGYYVWFRERMKLEKKREYFSKKFNMKIEEIPEYKIKSNLQKAIQILKRHRDYYFSESDKIENRPSSIILTTILAQIYDGDMSITELLMEFSRNSKKYIKTYNKEFELLNPVNPLENFADKWNRKPQLKNSFDQWIKNLREETFKLNENVSLYGADFISKIDEIYNVDLTNKLESGYQMKKITEIRHRKKHKWTERLLISVKIKSFKKVNGFQWKEFKSGEPLSKSLELRFEAVANNIKDYDIYWQITNTGSEAQSANCLRGDFYNTSVVEGKKVRDEKTLYVGSHIVECYLVKDNVCYGRSEPLLVNIFPYASFL